MLRHPLRHRRPLIAVLLLIGAIIGGYAWWHRIPNVTSALGPPPKVFHDPRLDTPLTITFNGVNFTQAIQQIADRIHVPITVDASLVADRGLDDYPVYFHAHQLPARLVIEHLMRQMLSNDRAACVETPAGVRIVSFEQTLADITPHTFDISAFEQIFARRNRSRWPDWWFRFTKWANQKLHPKAYIFTSSVDDLDVPRADVGAALADLVHNELPHRDCWEPIAPKGWWTETWTASGDWFVRASAEQQLRIYQLMREVYLGLAYGLDGRRLHPVSESRRRAMTWLASQPESWKQPPLQPADWLRRAERDGVSLSVCTTFWQASEKLMVWSVDEHGVVIAGDSYAGARFCILRTYDISDLIHARSTIRRPDQMEKIMDAIRNNVDRDNWVPVGVVNSMENMDILLIVSAPLETHDQVMDYLTKLREAKK